MTNETFIMDLGKLLIASAWVDGELSNEEVNALKDLLFAIPDITGDQWKQLEIYMDSPVTAEEREALLERVLMRISSNQDKALIIDTLTRLFQADGKITDQESALLKDVKEAVAKTRTGALAKMSRMITTSIKKRSDASRAATQRESRIDDFIMNTVYFQLESKRREEGLAFDLPEQRIRKLCFAAGLLAKIAAVDSGISENERETMQTILQQEWKLSDQEAALVTEASCQRALKGLDFYRTTRGFFDCTDYQERKAFLTCLFKIANASDMTSRKEVEEIRRIAESLKLPHQDFIEAKLTIPRKDREVL